MLFEFCSAQRYILFLNKIKKMSFCKTYCHFLLIPLSAFLHPTEMICCLRSWVFEAVCRVQSPWWVLASLGNLESY